MIKSAVSFFRKQLNVKGTSIHNGRGAYEMDYDCTVDELAERIAVLTVQHADMLNVADDGKWTEITLKKELAPDQAYRTLMFNADNGMLYCIMSADQYQITD